MGSSGQHAGELEVDEACTTSHQACQATCGDSSWLHVAKLTKAEQDYKEHGLRGHIPFRKDCEVCVRSSGKDRRHLRQKCGHGYTLSLDLGGPYLKGKDLYQDQSHVLIGTYQLPILDKPEVEDWYSIPDEFCAEDPLDDKNQSDVLAAVQRMTVKLQRHGYPLLRIHTDRGGEFFNRAFRSFCEAR